MTDFSAVNDEFERAVEIRRELNGVHWKQYRDMSLVFASMFGVKDGILKTIADMNYYQGGYPSEESPARIDAMMWKVADVACFFNAVGRLDELNRGLAPAGFKIVSDAPGSPIPMTMPDLEDKKVARALNRLLADRDFKYKPDSKEMIEWFLAQTKELQGVICEMADEIKIDIFEKVEEKLGEVLDKGGFTQAVNVVAKKRNLAEANKDTGGVIEKALSKSEVLQGNGEFLREKVTESVAQIGTEE
jgi:hypothetical protein